MEEDGFVLVKRKRNRGSRTLNLSDKHLCKVPEKAYEKYVPEASDPNVTATEITSICQKILAYKVEIRSDPFWKVFAEAVTEINVSEEIHEIVCYGLGSLWTGYSVYASRYQLALLLAITDILSIPVKAFDPVFCKSDIELLNSFNISILPENDSGKYSAGKRTLFFMPRCPFELFNNLLWRNWDNLSCIVILGNDLTNLDTQLPASELHRKYQFIVDAMPQMHRFKLSTKGSSLDNVMNDSAIQTFVSFTKSTLSQKDLEQSEPVGL